jgi:glycosyltransferase involved in cell wall biosynthesis
MKITVILCTYNRCQSLAKALDSVGASQLPNSVDWEVLVVDNNSTDQTREVVESFCRRQPGRFRYLLEPIQGLSQARNAGIREARGEILVFVDDDVVVDATWLQNLTAALHNVEWAGAGGRILLAQTFLPPRWLALDGPYAMGGMLYSGFDLGDEPGQLDRAPHGTNMAYRKEMFAKYGGFRTDLGRCADSTLSNEDTEFGRRLLAAGERLRYEPSAVVHHPMHENRVRKEYLLAWWFDFGRAAVREWERKPNVLGIPRAYFSMLKIVIASTLRRVRRWILALNPQRRFYWKCHVWMEAGQVAELYRQVRDAK